MQVPLVRNWNFGSEFPTKVMSCMLRDPDFLRETYQVLEPSYFNNDSLVVLAKIVLDFFREHGSTPHRSTIEALLHQAAETRDRDGSLGFLPRMMDWLHQVYNHEPHDVAQIKDLLRHFGRRQSLIRAMNLSLVDLENDRPEYGDKTITKIQEYFNKAFTVGSDQDDGVAFHDVAPGLPELIMQDQLYGQANKVPTGIPGLDKVLNGGLGIGEIGVIAGPPNRGKSTILANLAYHAAAHFALRAITTQTNAKSVVFVTLEMHATDIAIKMASITTQIPINDIVSRREEFSESIASKLATLSPVQIKFWSPGTASVDDVKWYLSNLQHIHGHEPGLLVLDYADRLRGGEDDRFKGMGVIFDSLIALGNAFKFPTWTGSQINRAEADAKTIKSTGIAESWKKIEAADVVITLNQTDEEYEKGLVRLYNAKVRRGKRGDTFFLKLDPARATLRPLTSEEMTSMQINSAPSDETTPSTAPQADFSVAMNGAPPALPSWPA